MALSSVLSLRKLPGVPTDIASQAGLQACLDAAEDAIQQYCGRQLCQQTVTHYLDGNGQRDLLLREWPVNSITNVWFDQSGYYGEGEDAFEDDPLTSGEDYVLLRDHRGTTSRGESGILRKLGVGAGTVPFGGSWAMWGGGLAPVRRSLAGVTHAAWPAGSGNVKVTYVCGYSSIPPSLEMACNQMALWMYRNSPFGGQNVMTSESFIDVSLSLAALAQTPELGSCRQLLSRFRRVSL